MSMTKKEALAIVKAVEEATPWSDGDHADAVVENAFKGLARSLADALGVPDCTCRWGHDEDYGDKSCPRRTFGEESS